MVTPSLLIGGQGVVTTIGTLQTFVRLAGSTFLTLAISLASIGFSREPAAMLARCGVGFKAVVGHSYGYLLQDSRVQRWQVSSLADLPSLPPHSAHVALRTLQPSNSSRMLPLT